MPYAFAVILSRRIGRAGRQFRRRSALLHYERGGAHSRDFKIHPEAGWSFAGAQVQARTGVRPDRKSRRRGSGAVTSGGKRVDLLYRIDRVGFGRMTSLKIINKLYIFVNNQFISNGIGIAKLEGRSGAS
jgi:hypothetical protein